MIFARSSQYAPGALIEEDQAAIFKRLSIQAQPEVLVFGIVQVVLGGPLDQVIKPLDADRDTRSALVGRHHENQPGRMLAFFLQLTVGLKQDLGSFLGLRRDPSNQLRGLNMLSLALNQGAAQRRERYREASSFDDAGPRADFIPRDRLHGLFPQPLVGKRDRLFFCCPVCQNDGKTALWIFPCGVKHRRNFINLAIAFPVNVLDPHGVGGSVHPSKDKVVAAISTAQRDSAPKHGDRIIVIPEGG